MSQRRLQAVRRRAAARQSLKTVAARQEGELHQLPDEPSLDEDAVAEQLHTAKARLPEALQTAVDAYERMHSDAREHPTPAARRAHKRRR